MSFLGLRMLKNPKWATSKKFEIFDKYPKGGPLEIIFFSFLFNTEFYCGISKETMTMLFRGLTILKSPKLIIEGGLCYGFAMVQDWKGARLKECKCVWLEECMIGRRVYDWKIARENMWFYCFYLIYNFLNFLYSDRIYMKAIIAILHMTLFNLR